MSKKIVLKAIVVSLLLAFVATTVQLPRASATELPSQEKGLTILRDVTNIDFAQYEVSCEPLASNTYYGLLPQQVLRYTLKSNESNLKLVCTFTNEQLHIINVQAREGIPYSSVPSTDTNYLAKAFLVNYQRYFNGSLYLELCSMLEKMDATVNSTNVFGNVKLEVNISNDDTNFKWTFTENGIDCVDKCVVLNYENGYFHYFVDTWALYPLGSCTVNISKEEAISIATKATDVFSWKVGPNESTIEITEFNTSSEVITRLFYSSSIHADKKHDTNTFAIYPVWRIGVPLDKIYPGGVYGISIDVWADTGEIKQIRELSSMLDLNLVQSSLFNEDVQSPSLKSQTNSSPISIVLSSIAAITAMTLLIMLKKSFMCRFIKSSSHKAIGILFCTLAFSLLLVPLPNVNADKHSTIWGSEFNKTANEIYTQFVTANLINNYFGAASYDSDNYRGTNTKKTSVLSNMSIEWPNYDFVAVVYFDHGIGDTYAVSYGGDDQWHYHVIDNYYSSPFNDHSIFDADIYSNTGSKQPSFAYISTCMSANLTYNCPQGGGLNAYNKAVGMPFAFTHRSVIPIDTPGFNTQNNISDDGYDRADNGDYCYIGFSYGSPSLTQAIDYHDCYYYEWLWDFFHAALYDNVSINDALDSASFNYFESDFGDTALHNGFTAYWSGLGYFGNCKMPVYGNGNINLR